MASVSAIRDGLQAALNTIPGLRAFDLIVDQVPVPCAVVGGPERGDAATYGNGRVAITFPVRAYISRSSERAGQDAMDAYLASSGPDSFMAAIEADRTLGGTVESAQVSNLSRQYGTYVVGGIEYLGFELEVEVLALG